MTRITTILVVEDERLVQELISLYLEKESFKVITAWDGQEALGECCKTPLTHP